VNGDYLEEKNRDIGGQPVFKHYREDVLLFYSNQYSCWFLAAGPYEAENDGDYYYYAPSDELPTGKLLTFREKQKTCRKSAQPTKTFCSLSKFLLFQVMSANGSTAITIPMG